MANGKRKDTLIWGVILIVLGALFLIDSLSLHFDVWHTLANFWPLILIVWGAWKLFLGIKEGGREDTPAQAKK